MKGAIISLTVIALIISSAIFSSMFTVRSITEMENELNEALPSKIGWERTIGLLNKINEDFKTESILLSLFAKDKEVFEIENYLSDLSISARKEASEEFEIAKSRLISTLRQIRQLHSLSINSIF